MLYTVPLLIPARVIVSVLSFSVCTGCVHVGADQKVSSQSGSGTQFKPPHAEANASSIVSTDSAIPDIASSFVELPVPERIVDGSHDDSELVSFADAELFTIVVQKMPVNDVLQALAQKASTNIEIVGDLDSEISLHVVDQSLESILKNIQLLLPVRYQFYDNRILVAEDKPFVRSYEVDYLNIERQSESRVDLATRVGSMRTAVDGDAQGQAGSNGSQLFVENKSSNQFWLSIVRSIAGVLGETVDENGQVSGNIFVNRESGIITVHARESQHRSVAKLLSNALDSIQRQVLIEATVVEVALNDRFESGVDWKLLSGNSNGSIDYAQILSGTVQASDAVAPANALLTIGDVSSSVGNFSATLKLLQQFGEVQVLSRPRIIALNNQPAVLKVVDNRVYFTYQVDRLQGENGTERTVVDSTLHSVPVGLVMSVTPFINQSDEVILNVRPTISRILNFTEDPSPALAGQSEVRNLIPEIQVREMESLLRVPSGKVAVIGGLMQNKTDQRKTGVPGLGRLPWLGKLFSNDIRTVEKTELLVFLKPTVVKLGDKT